MYVLAINCGSSSIKGRLYAIPSTHSQPLSTVASLGVSNISSKEEKVKIKVAWENQKGKDVNEDGDDGGSVQSEQQNHHAVLAVRACLDALPSHTSLLLFDTLFHVRTSTYPKAYRQQTIPSETYTYAIPKPELNTAMPIRKYGFHGLSYASIVSSLAQHLGKPEGKVNIVVAHLGSGASSCCIKGGSSIDTSGTRSGTIDPTAIFHAIGDPAGDAGIEGMKVSKAEALLNKKSGLQALAGTTNFGTILSRAFDPSADQHESASLAYKVYLDRLLSYVSQYLFKLLSTTPFTELDGIVFSGGIGEKGAELRRDVLRKFAWLGAEVDEKRNGQKEGLVREITASGSKLRGWVVETDEEGWCAKLAREEFGF